MRILIYGAGVIGRLYAALFAQAGIDTTVYARGQRLAMFRERGLKYAKGKRVAQANVRIVDKVAPDDVYDFVFLTVKENQVHTALKELRENTSSTIVTMLNTLEPYSAWEALCGEGRLLPAFPGAGGGFEGECAPRRFDSPACTAHHLRRDRRQADRKKPPVGCIVSPSTYPVPDRCGYACMATLPSGHGGAHCRCLLRSKGSRKGRRG